MPRKADLVIDVNQIRADAYHWHFDCRQFALAHPQRLDIAHAIESLERPLLGLFGQEDFSGRVLAYYSIAERMEYYRVAQAFGIEHPGRLLYWYWTVEGWVEFERQWLALPEVIHIPLCTTSGVIHLSTGEAFIYPSDKAKK